VVCSRPRGHHTVYSVWCSQLIKCNLKEFHKALYSPTVTEDESLVELGLPSLDAPSCPCKNYTRPNRFPRDSSLEEDSKYR
jgi:hypothetical protein